MTTSRGVPRDKRGITLRHLLTHTAGLVDALGDDYDPLTRRAMVTAALASELRTTPGARYHYSNLGYSLLAAIIEEASGMGYEEYLVKELFAPAGMTQTGYVLPDWDAADVAVEYDDEGSRPGPAVRPAVGADGPYWNLRGNGGILSTAHDMGRWLLALEGDRVLDEHAKAALFRPRVLEEPGRRHPLRLRLGGRGDTARDGGLAQRWQRLVVRRAHPAARQSAGIFWVTNQFRSASGGWNFDRLRPSLTERVAKRLVDGD